MNIKDNSSKSSREKNTSSSSHCTVEGVVKDTVGPRVRRRCKGQKSEPRLEVQVKIEVCVPLFESLR